MRVLTLAAMLMLLPNLFGEQKPRLVVGIDVRVAAGDHRYYHAIFDPRPLLKERTYECTNTLGPFVYTIQIQKDYWGIQFKTYHHLPKESPSHYSLDVSGYVDISRTQIIELPAEKIAPPLYTFFIASFPRKNDAWEKRMHLLNIKTI